ncbi:TPA: ABC transporter ATP-binding protein [Clostridioides difficile]|uniref:ABC transporter ATP-binding protein n=1 Tax=Clostridioides difficile TaxID=1496 RepID=UPI00038D115A|nr:ABC transporter ATP-binding protein [Clostridioides difficile]EQE83037.1 ABC transporter family protein [Clostridioides difficile CD69]HBF7938528.1 ABC transporter ATP-binding protein [Clostridioides difficile]HBG6491523.1 ABC transporter ATP-binding protein [Clostridioides difficile]
MADIKLENVTKSYNKKNTVIENLNLTIEDGSFTVLVGPSGCGKSTTLRMIAGLEDITSGKLKIEENDVTNTDASKRDIAMVFQNYALYPHMTVRENIEFGLKNKKVEKEKREKLITEVIDVVGLREYLDVKPGNLSGGQRQRVALARAMVKNPKVFLMDEPLSNLDAKLRNQMRTELIQLHQKLKSTFVYVTHDQVEAMSMADKIVIMNKGKIMQIGSPKKIYQNPKNLFVAQFIGNPCMNILDIKNDVKLGFRPEKAKLESINIDGKNDDVFNLFGKVVTKEVLGNETIYCLSVLNSEIRVKTENDIFDIGRTLRISVLEKDLYYFDKNGERIEDLKICKNMYSKIKGDIYEKAI